MVIDTEIMQNSQGKASINPPPKKVKRGPKKPGDKIEIERKLRELFDEDGITPWLASRIVGCDFRFAVSRFNHYAEQIIEAEEQDWIARNEKVRKRALEGISTKIKIAKEDLKIIEKQLDTNQKFQEAAIHDTVEYLKKSPIGIAMGHLKEEDFFDLVSLLRRELDIHKSYGFLLVQDIQQLRSQRTFAAELQQQYDSIEILPPPSAVLELELEKRIAAKQELMQPAIPGRKKI